MVHIHQVRKLLNRLDRFRLGQPEAFAVFGQEVPAVGYHRRHHVVRIILKAELPNFIRVEIRVQRISSLIIER
ncbi:hypothetical protein D1872_324730 [compost metagenome]